MTREISTQSTAHKLPGHPGPRHKTMPGIERYESTVRNPIPNYRTVPSGAGSP